MEVKTIRDFYCFMNYLKSGLYSQVINLYNPIFMEMTDENNYRPIHVACHNGFVKIVQFFVNKSVDLESKSTNGWRPIHHACFSGSLEIINLLVSNDCNIEAFDQSNWRPIHWSCNFGHYDIIKLLIHKKCHINAPGLDDLRPIHIACRYGHKEIVKLLIDNKCSLDVCDNRKWQPIHIASYKGNIEIVKILVKAQCNLEIGDKNNQWPCDIARKYGHSEIFNMLKNETINKIIESMVVSLELKCHSECNHDFCEQSIRSSKIKKGDLIGEGCFSKVYKYNTDKIGREVVIKRVKNNSRENSLIEHNINKYRFIMHHDRIVHYYGAMEHLQKLCIYMEYVSGGSLANYVSKEKPLSHSQSIFFCKQILDGVAFLHGLKIIHRDIKSPNILLDKDKNIKLSDFGLSRSLQSITNRSITHSASTFCGTLNYMAPEIMKDEHHSFPADIWSVGAVMTEMLSGNPPFYRISLFEIVQSVISTGRIEYKTEKPLSRELTSFVDRMLQRKPSKRASAKLLLKDNIILKNTCFCCY